jgi:hypothetical protein
MKSMYRKGYFLGILDRIRLVIFCTAPDPSFNATANRGHSFSCALSLYHETDLKNVANGARSGSGMDIPDHISESFETIFGVKTLKFFDADTDPGIFLILDPGRKKFGSWINIPDPQHWQ